MPLSKDDAPSKWRETIGEGFGTAKNKDGMRNVPIRNEDDGTNAGYHVEHWDGRQDAHVEAKPIRVGTRVDGVSG